MPTLELCELAKKNGVKQFAVTYINNTSACLEFLKITKETSLKALVGIDFRNGAEQQYVGIAKNNAGYRQLNKHLSSHIHAHKDFPAKSPPLPDCFIIYSLDKIIRQKKKDFRENEFIGISTESLRKLKFSEYRKLKDKLVLLQTVSFRNKKDYNAHRLLRAIDNNTLLSKLPESEQGAFHHQMISPADVEQEFEDFPHILENTHNLMDLCQVDFEFGRDQNRNLKIAGRSEQEDEKKAY